MGSLPVQHWVIVSAIALMLVTFVAWVAYCKWVMPLYEHAFEKPSPRFAFSHIATAVFLFYVLALAYIGYRPPNNPSTPAGHMQFEEAAEPEESMEEAEPVNDVHTKGVEIQKQGQKDLDDFRSQFLRDK